MIRTASALASDAEIRIENRQRIVHVVQYNRYPRRNAEEDRRVAYTQDRSDSGLGLDLPEEVAPGELLRITVHDIDGGVNLDGIARVVWCQGSESGRARAGISILREQGERPLLRVRPPAKTVAGSLRRGEAEKL